jgi:hypothetical protein
MEVGVRSEPTGQERLSGRAQALKAVKVMARKKKKTTRKA